jgi:glycosyltransferase involved in cell wall biosynthesis
MEEICLSTVTPVYQGARYLADLVAALSSVREEWAERGGPLALGEAVFVDDGSIDSSSQVLAQLQIKYPWMRVVTLGRNFGQHAATIAGILHTSGDWVATLDEDLQHHPQHLLSLLRHAVEAGCDVVYANATGPVHQSFVRDASSRLYKTFVSRLSGNPHARLFSSFRIVRGPVARAASAVTSHDTYFDVALCWFTNRVGSVELHLKDLRYIEQKRSGYGFRSLLQHARRMLMSSQVKFLRIGALLGMVALNLSVAMGITIGAVKLINPEAIEVRGWTSLFLTTLFFGGLISFLLGVLLEYMSVLVLQAQGKPTFFVVDRSRDALLADHFKGLSR